MTEPPFPDDLTFYPISKQKTSIPYPGLVWSAFADYDRDCREQIYFWKNRAKVLSDQNFILKECLAEANCKNEDLTRSLADAKREILHLRSSSHPESPDGKCYDDWVNRREED